LEPLWLEWIQSFFAQLFRVDRRPVLNKDESVLQLQIEKIQANIEKLQRKFGKGDLDADLYTPAATIAKEELLKARQQLAALPKVMTMRSKPWADMTFDEKREAVRYMLNHVLVFNDHVVVHFQSNKEKKPMMFPFMKRNTAHRCHVRATTCLTPCLLKHRDAFAVMTRDFSTVNWHPWVADNEFW
jgi:hypothetical protein